MNDQYRKGTRRPWRKAPRPSRHARATQRRDRARLHSRIDQRLAALTTAYADYQILYGGDLPIRFEGALYIPHHATPDLSFEEAAALSRALFGEAVTEWRDGRPVKVWYPR